MILRLIVTACGLIMMGVSLIVAVVVMLGVGWVAVAIPTVLCLALVSAVAALWRRWWAPAAGKH